MGKVIASGVEVMGGSGCPSSQSVLPRHCSLKQTERNANARHKQRIRIHPNGNDMERPTGGNNHQTVKREQTHSPRGLSAPTTGSRSLHLP